MKGRKVPSTHKDKVMSLLTKCQRYTTEPILLLIAFFTSLTIAPIFWTPFKNPDNISNPFNAYGFNPSTNYTTMVVTIVGTALLFLLFRRLYASKYAWVIKVVAITVLLTNQFVFNMLDISTGYYHVNIIYANGPHSLDNFHSGEQLAPGNAFLHGKMPYKDMFFLRGSGVDVLVPALGFLIFGNSIGSFLLITHLFMLLTMLGFFLLLWVVVKGTLRYIGAIALFFGADALSLVEIRDIPVWTVMGLIIYYFQIEGRERLKKIILVAVGLLASLELYVAIDRGMLLCVLAGIFAISLLLFGPNKKSQYTFTPRLWKERLPYALFCLLGLVIGLMVPALFLGWDGFKTFLQMTFVDIPTYGGLLVSSQFPDLFSPDYLIWGPVLIATATGYLLIKLWDKGTPKDMNKLIPYTVIFLFTTLGLKAGANRIYIQKMAQVVAPLYFIAFAVLCLAIYTAYKNRTRLPHLLPAILISLIMFGYFSQLSIPKIFRQPRYTHSEIRHYLGIRSLPNSYWVDQNTQQVSYYIDAHTNSKDPIFVFPADPTMYYTANRPNPTRFYISWYADPQMYTHQMLADLKKDPPKIVVYQENTWMDAPDGINVKTRLPEVDTWLTANYPKRIQIGDTTLLER